ncbi:protein phosphatase 1K, mitochondrial-like [Pecten maximus]|uniref:protein phosphatase 1K, mitochondrial-like n=1 Tax=Pecten maximus TaxID=6579 RepID=UPI0014584E5C|nr:protein phosphatase 1K, mitochondrial-like [Pecten maximus]XP_033728619.1 protein phosphatase 1K, mitochondrial-like [Pecten maximus]XP_033728620.1 protein phosphatase 1K, mitochondrial-like [Pecten maximus]
MKAMLTTLHKGPRLVSNTGWQFCNSGLISPQGNKNSTRETSQQQQWYCSLIKNQELFQNKNRFSENKDQLRCYPRLYSSIIECCHKHGGKQFRLISRNIRPSVRAPTRFMGVLSDPENKGKKQVGINFDTIGSWNNRISMPILIKESIQTGKLIPQIPLEKIGTASLLGRRNRNEDRYAIKKLSSEYLYFGIFDGHNGDLASEYLQSCMSDSLSFWLSREPDESVVLRQSFIDLNNSLARHLTLYWLDDEQFSAGSTATVCVLQHSTELTIGHVGDTRALLCRGGKAIALTQDHNPDNIGERKRIQARGGVITPNSLGTPKVNGNLSMTRCIGNLPLKKYGVTEHPEIKTKKLDHGRDAFLALVSDGVSFVLSDQEVVDITCSCTNPQEAASRVTDQALQFGSEDNATCVIIPLGAWGKYSTDTGTIQYSFGRTFVPLRDS